MQLTVRISCAVLISLLAACSDDDASNVPPSTTSGTTVATNAVSSGTAGASSSATALAVATASLKQATAHNSYTATLAATGGAPPYAWSVAAGALPSGLTLSSAGVLSGTPTDVGTAAFTVKVTDSASKIRAQSLTLPVTTPGALTAGAAPAAAIVDTAYTGTLTATGGSGSYTWTLVSGSLPAGVTLNANGTLTGTPTAVGINAFTVSVVDSGTSTSAVSQAYNLMVDAASTGTQQVTLATTASNYSVGSTFAGMSYEKYEMGQALFSPQDTTLVGLFSRLGPSVLRIGGASVDHTAWNANGAGETSNQTAPADLVRLNGFLKACNWQVLYGIQFLNEAASPVTTADPAQVAAEAVAAMQTLGDSLYAFEIGNEPDLYYTRISGFTYANFQAQWEVDRNAILAAVAAAKAAGTLPQSATARFTGPGAAFNLKNYVIPFAAAEASDIVLLTRHYYVANGTAATSTMSTLLSPDPALLGSIDPVQTATTGNNIPGYRITEANSLYFGGKAGVSDAFGSALWALNFMFETAWAGASGVNFHSGWNVAYTPIDDNGHAAYAVAPEYYGIDLFAQAANGKLVATTSTPSSTTLTTYAVSGAGVTHIVVVNASATDANVNVHFNGSVSSATYVTLTAPSVDATSGQLMNGATIETDGTSTAVAPPALTISGGTLQVPVPAGSAILLNAQ